MAQRLLLADDSVTIQKVIELTFADEHIEVVAVSDGTAAVARLNAEPFDIVLADAGMPGVNGFDVATFVRDRPAGRIPVILLTGAFDPVDDSRVASVGASAVLASRSSRRCWCRRCANCSRAAPWPPASCPLRSLTMRRLPPTCC